MPQPISGENIYTLEVQSRPAIVRLQKKSEVLVEGQRAVRLWEKAGAIAYQRCRGGNESANLWCTATVENEKESSGSRTTRKGEFFGGGGARAAKEKYGGTKHLDDRSRVQKVGDKKGFKEIALSYSWPRSRNLSKKKGKKRSLFPQCPAEERREYKSARVTPHLFPERQGANDAFVHFCDPREDPT